MTRYDAYRGPLAHATPPRRPWRRYAYVAACAVVLAAGLAVLWFAIAVYGAPIQ